MKNFFDEQDNDYKFSEIWISEKLRLLIRQVKIAWKQSPLASGYQTRLSLHTVTYAKKVLITEKHAAITIRGTYRPTFIKKVGDSKHLC